MTEDDLLGEQLAYYRARAGEYDASLESITSNEDSFDVAARREWNGIVRAVRNLGHYPRGLELAAGTGIWTKELVPLTSELTVLDGSPEMLEINRTRINDPRARYECVDLFTWEPETQYDLVFFSFWLSHVPPSRLAPFLDKVGRAVRVGGTLIIIDEPAGGLQLSGPNEGGLHQERTVGDGREFRIIKVYYDPSELQGQLLERGLQPVEVRTGRSFFMMRSKRR